MSLLGRLTRPTRGIWYLRRVWAELRGIRRALERQADALEFAALAQQSADQPHAQAFRSMATTKEQLDERELRNLTEVSYVNDRQLAEMLRREDELRAVYGRDPSEAELERAFAGREV